MIINTTDPHMGIFAGITIFDEAGRAISRVQDIDTETLSCTVGSFGKKVQAAGFVLAPNSALHNYIPDGLIPHVYPGKNPTKEELQGFIQFHLNHRQLFFDTTAKYLEDFKAYQSSTATSQVRETWHDRYHDRYTDSMEETFNWPREPFKTMAKEVRPSEEEEDLAASKHHEKTKWERGTVVHEDTFDIIGDITLPWGDKIEFTNADDKPEFSSLWLRSKNGELVSWGVAVKAPCNFAIPNSILHIHMIGGLGLMEGNHDVPGKLWKPLYEKTWKVISTRGKPNGTVELMLIEEKSPLGDLPSFVPPTSVPVGEEG